jgi:hypothetical protein
MRLTDVRASCGGLACLLLTCAGCASFAGTVSVEDVLGRIPLLPAEAPRTDLEQLLALGLRDFLADGRPDLPKTHPFIVRSEPAWDVSRVLPGDLEGKVVFLSSEQLAELHARFGQQAYIELDAKVESPTHASVEIYTTVTAPKGALVLCCGGELFVFEKKGGRWTRDRSIIREIYL